MVTITSRLLVSVLMPVYNAEKYLAEAIQSILDQSYAHFEFLIIDDGSTDRSAEIAAHFAQRDRRIRLIRHPDNHGLVAALNLGLDLAKGEYIARMDADDVSLPERFERQVEYLRLHPEIGVLGCRIHYMDESGKLSSIPVSFHGRLAIRWNLLFTNPFSHPAVVMRKSVIDQHHLRYDPEAAHVEDYEFWGRFLSVSEGENLPDVLLLYRIHSTSVGSAYGKSQNERAARVSAEIIERYLPRVEASPKEIERWTKLMWGFVSMEHRDRAQWMPTYLKIWHAFSTINKNEPALGGLRWKVIPWAALFILYPLFQQGWIKASWLLTRIEWRWLFFLLVKLPYFFNNRRSMHFFMMGSGE